MDDGITVFGLVEAKSSNVRHDLTTVEREYLAKAAPRRAPTLVQETTNVGVIPFCVGAQTRILLREAVALR